MASRAIIAALEKIGEPKPRASLEELSQLEQRIGCRLATEVRVTLAASTGCTVDGFGEIDLVGRKFAKWFEFRGILPRGYAVAQAAPHGFWCIDMNARGEWGSILLASHDPAVFVRRFGDLLEMLDFLRASKDQLATTIARSVTAAMRESGIPWHEAHGSNDPLIRVFAETLADDYRVFDLRGEARGQGFAWDLGLGAETKVRRHGDELLFAVQAPADIEAIPEAGFFEFLKRLVMK